MKLSKSLALFFASSLLALTACGSSTIGGGTGAGGGTTGEGGSDGGSTGGGAGGGTGGTAPLDCSALTVFDKTCTADADCVTKLHQINCCGTMIAIGINDAGSASFDALEATCAAQFPGCGCATMPTMAEDGNTQTDFGTPIPVACKAGQCMTYIEGGPVCNGVPSPVSCAPGGCPAGWDCVVDPDPTTCHPSNCSCAPEGWACTADCGMNGSSCVKGL